MSKEQRYIVVDALRGMGALIVLCHHLNLFIDFRKPSLGAWLTHYSPLRLLVSGRTAVLMFFVLSGFALAAMVHNNLNYPSYAMRRICRVMLPLIAVLIVSAVADFVLAPQTLLGISDWANGMIWSEPLTWAAFFRHVFLFGLNHDIFLDGVIWSLVYEMRLSLVFPLLYKACLRWPRCTFGICVILYAVTSFYVYRLNTYYVGGNWYESVLITLNFLPLFALGAYLFIHRDRISAFCARLKNWQWYLLLGVSYFFLVDRNEWLVVAGCAILLIWAFVGGPGTGFFERRPAQFLGQISYSLYLTQLVTMAVLLHTTRITNTAGLTVLMFFAALLVGTLFKILIERPSIALSRMLGKSPLFMAKPLGAEIVPIVD